MKVINDLVQVDDLQFIATESTIRTSGLVLSKVKFDDQLRQDLESCDFDFDNFAKLKDDYANGLVPVENIQSAAPKILYLKQRKKDADAVAVAIAIDDQVYLNKNVDDKLGVSADATRYRYMSLINGFIRYFGLTQDSIKYFDGQKFICTKSAVDDRRSGAVKTDDSTIDW